MKRIHLTPRLQMTAELVPRGARLADIGTDHAYLPAALARRGELEEVSSGLEEMKKEWKRWQL